jgi:hypothetical protein
MNKLVGSIGALAIICLVLVANALAGGSTSVNGYAGTAGTIQSGVKSNGTLPFTGLDLGLVAGAAAAALVVGTFMRRLSRSRS